MSTTITSRDRLAAAKHILKIARFPTPFYMDGKIAILNSYYGVFLNEPFTGLPEPRPDSPYPPELFRRIFSSLSEFAPWDEELPAVPVVKEVLKNAGKGEHPKFHFNCEEYAWRADYLLDVLKLIGPAEEMFIGSGRYAGYLVLKGSKGNALVLACHIEKEKKNHDA